MQEIRCPKCGKVFQVDDAGYRGCLLQVSEDVCHPSTVLHPDNHVVAERGAKLFALSAGASNRPQSASGHSPF